jgi:OPA family glycerol-3-phosphate transporter-like MFS transporter
MGIEESWRAAFIAPAVVALFFAGMCWWFIRDTPESCGLPPIEKYRNDHTGAKAKKGEEQKIPFKRLFIDYIFKNPTLWLIGFANIFVYFIRYGVADWSPIYLNEVCGMSLEDSSLAYTIREYSGIVGTVLCGWISSKFFQGRCAPVNVIYMLLVALGVLAYWQALPLAEMMAMDVKYIVYGPLALIGAAIYGPVAMISIQAIAIVPKNAAGTAAGFMGLLGYLVGDAILSKIAFGYIADSSLGWNFTFVCFFATSIIAAVICVIAWGKEKRMMDERLAAAKSEQK